MSRMIRVSVSGGSIISYMATLSVRGWLPVGEGHNYRTAEEYAAKHGAEGDWILEIKGKIVIADKETTRDFAVGDVFGCRKVVSVADGFVIWEQDEGYDMIVTNQQGVPLTIGNNHFKPTRPVVKTGQAYKKLDTSGEY